MEVLRGRLGLQTIAHIKFGLTELTLGLHGAVDSHSEELISWKNVLRDL